MRGRHFLFALLATVLSFANVNVADAAGKRVALVIGNAVYEHTSMLANPANDAELIAKVLKAQGFEVDPHINADLKKMKRAISNMANAARAHGSDTVVVFYYAGHGVQVGKSNYLIPVDAKIDTESDVTIEALNVDSLLESLAEARATINVIVLDACRNNPYRASFRSGGSGLARIDRQLAGFLIAFSTDPGRVATDGPLGGNSPYTQALAAAFARPDLKIEETFKEVRKQVFENTRGLQVPWDMSSLVDELYIGGRRGGEPVKTSQTTSDEATARERLQTELAKAAAEAEKARAETELAKSEAARRKARTEIERANAEAEQAAAELAKARAEAELARTQAEADLARARAQSAAARAQADAEKARAQADTLSRSPNQFAAIDTTSLFTPAAVPSFSCSEYRIKPVGHPDRNPQTDILCIVPEAARMDYQLGQAFHARIRGFSGTTRQEAIAIQKQWILMRNHRCAASWTDLTMQDRRTAIANCLVRETSVRIQELRR